MFVNSMEEAQQVNWSFQLYVHARDFYVYAFAYTKCTDLPANNMIVWLRAIFFDTVFQNEI